MIKKKTMFHQMGFFYEDAACATQGVSVAFQIGRPRTAVRSICLTPQPPMHSQVMRLI